MVILASMELPNEPPAAEPIEPRPSELSFALTRDSVTLTDLLSRASETWSRDLATWVLAMLLYWLLGLGIPFGLNMVWWFFSAIQEGNGEASAAFATVNIIVQIVVYMVQLALSAVFTLGLWAIAVRGLHGQKSSVGALFSQLSKIWKYIVQWIAMVAAGVLFLLPPVAIVLLMFVGPVDLDTPMTEIMDDAARPFGIAMLVMFPVYLYAVLGLVFCQAELAFNDDAGPIDAIVYSWRIARGKRWQIIGVGLLAVLIAMGSAMLCGIGLLFGGPLSMLLFGALYLALRNGAVIPAANTGTTLGRQY